MFISHCWRLESQWECAHCRKHTVGHVVAVLNILSLVESPALACPDKGLFVPGEGGQNGGREECNRVREGQFRPEIRARMVTGLLQPYPISLPWSNFQHGDAWICTSSLLVQD